MSARKRKCPTPKKKAYPTRQAAEYDLHYGHFTHWKAPCRAYPCRGHFHLTSRPKR